MKILVGDLPLAARAGTVVATDLDAALAALHEHRRERVLVVAEPEIYEHAARMVRNAVAGPDVTLAVVGGYRTARVHVAAALCRLSPEDYGLARLVAAELATRVHTRLALTGVSRLSTPSPTLGQQLAGWWPTTRFEVDAAAGTVTRTREFSWGVESHLLAIETGSDPRGKLRIAHGVAGPELTLAPPAHRPAYASAVWAEQSVAPRDLGDTVAGLCDAMPRLACPLCGRRRAPDLCLWCGSHQRAGTSGTQGTASNQSAPGTQGVQRGAGEAPIDWTITEQDLPTTGATR